MGTEGHGTWDLELANLLEVSSASNSASWEGKVASEKQLNTYLQILSTQGQQGMEQDSNGLA